MKKSATDKHSQTSAMLHAISIKLIIQYLWIVAFLLLVAAMAFAQDGTKNEKAQLNEDFRKIAKEIKESYDNGKLNNVIDLYTKYCRKDDKGKTGKEKKVFKKVGKEIRADIYQWVVLSYDGLDEPEMRDIYLKKLLDIRHDLEAGNYRPSIKDRAKKLCVVAPRLLLGIKTGASITIAHPVNSYSILEPTASIDWNPYEKDYIYNIAHLWGLQLGFIVEYALTKNFSVSIQLSSIDLRFLYKNSFKWEVGEEGGGEPFTLSYTHRHKLYYVEIPFLLKYRFGNIQSKVKPYLQIGGFYRILQFAHKSIHILLETEGTKNLNLKELFTRSGSGFWVGAGIGYDTRVVGLPLRLEIEVNYKHGLNNIVNEDQRYENKELIFGYYDVFDDLKLRNWDLAFKVLLPISFKAFKR